MKILLLVLLLQGQEPYVFTQDGEPLKPWVLSLNGTPEDPQPGDVVSVGYVFLTLGSEKRCSFEVQREPATSIYLKLADGRRILVGAHIATSWKEDVREVVNPLSKLKPDEIRGLWGLRLDAWNEDIQKSFELIDPARTCVSMGSGPWADRRAWPEFPSDLRYLITGYGSSMSCDPPDFSRLRSLRFLWHDMGDSLDCAAIRDCADLRYLDLSGQDLKNANDLSRLTQVTSLDLSWTNILEVNFAKSMPMLTDLEIDSSKTEDLAGLSDHIRIRSIRADFAPLKTLPHRSLPQLRKLRIMSTPLNQEAVTEFARANPACVITQSWNDELRRALAGATRLRVRTGGSCHRDKEKEETLLESEDATLVADASALIQVDEKSGRGSCMCCGGPTIEFYKGPKLDVAISLHHGVKARWNGWPSDGNLTAESSKRLRAWLRERKITIVGEEADSEK